MFQELKFQLSTAILTMVTIAAGVSAVINFQQQNKFRLPDDGVIWVDRTAGVTALEVVAGGPGAKAGLRSGDVVRSINGSPITEALQVSQILVGVGSWKRAEFEVERSGVEFKTPLIIGDVPPDSCKALPVHRGSDVSGHRLVRLFPPRQRA